MKKAIIVVSLILLLSFTIFAQKITVTFWEGMGAKLGDTLTQITNLFNQQNPNIEVKLVYLGSDSQVDSKLLTAVQAKNLPTMSQVVGPWAASLQQKGVIAPMQFFPNYTELVGQIYPALLQDGSFGGIQYTLPFNRDVFLLFTRPQMLSNAGIGYPTTMQELAKDAKLLTIKKNGKTTRYGVGFRTTYRQFTAIAYQFGGSYLDKNGNITINSTPNLNALTFLVNLVKGGYAYGKFGYFDNELTDSSVALLFGGDAELTYDLSDISGQSDGIKMVPIPSDVTFKPMLYGNSLVIYNTSSKEEQAAAWKYVQFLLSPSIQLYWALETGYIPLNKEVQNLSQWKNFVAQNQNGMGNIMAGLENSESYAPSVAWWPDVTTVIQTAFQNAISLKMTPKAALDQAQQQAVQIRDKYLNK